MNKVRQKKLVQIILMLIGVGMSLSLALYALRENISLYFTPTQITHEKLSSEALVRIGGIVAKNSVIFAAHSAAVKFAVTDSHSTVWVAYQGVLPALFRVGQGVVVQGYLQNNGVFLANQVLAKHGSNYHAA